MQIGGRSVWQRREVLSRIGAGLSAIGVGNAVSATPGREPGPKENEILVGVAKTVSDLEAAVATHIPSEAEIVHSNDRIGYVAVTLPEWTSEQARENLIDAIPQNAGIRFAEHNETVETLCADDPKLGDQHAPYQITADRAWCTQLGDESVTISIVDQGIQYDHEDLPGDYFDVTSDGYDFVNDDSDPYPASDSEYHGTFVAGLALAVTNNETGIGGISNSSMLSARALDEMGSGTLSDVADAITWSADQGADVINLSIGTDSYSDTLKNAVTYAQNQGSLIVGAAGSSGDVSYPAAYDEVLAVSALDTNDDLMSNSSYGPEIELCAPGEQLLSTIPWNDYGYGSGTSAASPIVAGVAGLAIAEWDTDNAATRRHLKETAVDIGLSPDEQGEGRVDAYNAVTVDPFASDENVVTITSSLSGSGDSDCWFYQWEFDNTSQVVIDLDGPDSGAVFDLYANTGRSQCPTTSDYDYISYNWGADETIIIDDPDDSTPLYVLVDAWDGSGEYTLTITETA